MPHPDVLVVGGGVVGAACARSLARRGHRVAIVEAGPKPGAASLVAAGMLAPLAEAAPGDPLLGLAVRARDHYGELAPMLKEEAGVDIGLWQAGILEAAFTEDEVTRGRSQAAWQRQSGFAAEWLSSDELRERAPGVSPEARGASLAPEDGALDPLALLDALMRSAESAGAALLRGESAERLLIREGRVEGVETPVQKRYAGAVLIAAGAWSNGISGLPRPLSVHPIRGQIATLDWPKEYPAIIIYCAGGYLLHQSGRAVAGTTMENVGFNVDVTEAGLDHIRSVIRRILPSLAEKPFTHTRAGFRPGTPDGCPIIGPDPVVSGLWYATGHGRNGILYAGYTGELLAQLLAGEPVEHDLSAVSPARFWRW